MTSHRRPVRGDKFTRDLKPEKRIALHIVFTSSIENSAMFADEAYQALAVHGRGDGLVAVDLPENTSNLSTVASFNHKQLVGCLCFLPGVVAGAEILAAVDGAGLLRQRFGGRC